MSKTDYDLLSTAPPDEKCAEDSQEARVEGRRYIELLRKSLGTEPNGSQLKIRSNPHDLGSYITVAYFFDDENEEHLRYFHKLDEEGPLKWETP